MDATSTPTAVMPHGPAVLGVTRVLLVLAAASFLVGALLHAGVGIPVGFTTLAEPRILGATVVEGICGVALSIGAYGTVARESWGPRAARAASVLAVIGVLLGMTLLAAGAGPRTDSNDFLHIIMLVLLLAVLSSLPRAARS